MHRELVWIKEANFGAELADVKLDSGRLLARGFAIGAVPVPYRLEYSLITSGNYVTSQLKVRAQGLGWKRKLDLRRDAKGIWESSGQAEGEIDLADGKADLTALSESNDCDLALSPLTNSMPVLRHDLLDGGGPIDFLMAWVSVPDLNVRPSVQRYTFVGNSPAGKIIRYQSGTFTADLEFDDDGFVRYYPGLAKQISQPVPANV